MIPSLLKRPIPQLACFENLVNLNVCVLDNSQPLITLHCQPILKTVMLGFRIYSKTVFPLLALLPGYFQIGNLILL